METGLMRHKIELQQLVSTRNEYGEPTNEWKTAASVRASISPVSGRDFLAAMKEHSEVTHKITIRYCKIATPAMRVVYQARVFQIMHIIDPWENHTEMTLMCKELVT